MITAIVQIVLYLSCHLAKILIAKKNQFLTVENSFLEVTQQGYIKGYLIFLLVGYKNPVGWGPKK